MACGLGPAVELMFIMSQKVCRRLTTGSWILWKVYERFMEG